MTVYLLYKILARAVTFWIYLQCFCYATSQCAEVREASFTTINTNGVMILHIAENYDTDSETMCAVQCKITNKTCYGFSFNRELKRCSLGSWLVPANASATRDSTFSNGPFCQTLANVTLQPDGDLTSCDKYACSSSDHIMLGNNTDITSLPRYKSCKDIIDKTSPRMLIRLLNGLVVMCDTESDGGGWTIFQRRITGQLVFNENWSVFKAGFGDYEKGEFYLGNENIHCLTSTQNYDMRVDVKWGGQNFTFNFTQFRITNESTDYTFIVATSSPSMYGNHNNTKFSTKDVDNDPGVNGDCAKTFKSGWWFCGGCFYFNLNGIWNGTNVYGVIARSISLTSSVYFTEMKIREK